MRDTSTPKILILSSGEAIGLAEMLQVTLGEWSYPEVWNQGLFEMTKTNIENLERKIPLFDYCILFLTPDDSGISRGRQEQTPRDNVIFEAGLSTGILGRERTLIIQPESVRLKIPSDMLGVHIQRYNDRMPNVRAALQMVATLIRAYIGDRNREVVTRNKHMINQIECMNTTINSNYRNHYNKLLKTVYDQVLGAKLMRENWRIDIQYNVEKLQEGIISEKIEFEYRLFNITDEPVSYPLSLMYLDDGVSYLYTMSRIDEYGDKREIFNEENTNIAYRKGNVIKKVQEVELLPDTAYVVHMDFAFLHNVSKTKPFIHNSLAPIQPTFGTTVKVNLPSGYEFDLLGLEGQVADECRKIGNTQVLYYNIPYVLLSQQIIEYVFQRKDEVNEKF